MRLLSAGIPGLRIGYDPCYAGALELLRTTRAYVAFVADAVAASPEAELVYLDHSLVILAAGDGFDLVGAFHDAGRRVDAYTLRQADDAGVATARRLLELKVDQITTDYPEALGLALSRHACDPSGVLSWRVP